MKNESVCNPKTFDMIYESHAKDLHNYLFYKFGDTETAKDVVQESFIKLWNKCIDILLNKAKSFLFKVATNLYIDKKRHDKIVLNYQKDFRTGLNYEDPEFLLQEKEFMVKLQKTIGSLPDKQREVFLLNRIDKKTYKEISEMIGISVKAVEKRMHNALQKVRNEIGKV